MELSRSEGDRLEDINVVQSGEEKLNLNAIECAHFVNASGYIVSDNFIPILKVMCQIISTLP